MSLKRKLARFGSQIERWIDSALRRKPKAPAVIAPYIGYATPDHLMVRGRVLSKLREDTVRDGQSRWINLRQMARLFLTDEVAGVLVSAGDYSAETDEEGYFTILVPRDGQAGWVEITVMAGDASADCPVMVADPDAKFGVISDIDDTQMETGAYSLIRNIWTSLTGNALTRKVYPDAVALMNQLHDGGRNPVYYVSSSPWNLHSFLEQIFDRAGLPRGPMFLRDFGISETQFITGTHGDHKGSAVDRIIAAHPDLNFILIGDTGQHDAQVYFDAIQRHPGRIDHIVLRAAGRVDDADRAGVGRIREAGVPVTLGTDYAEAIVTLSVKAGAS